MILCLYFDEIAINLSSKFERNKQSTIKANIHFDESTDKYMEYYVIAFSRN